MEPVIEPASTKKLEAAAQECRAHATQQLDIALASLREPLEVEEAQDDVASKWKKVCKIRNAAEDDLLLQKILRLIYHDVMLLACF